MIDHKKDNVVNLFRIKDRTKVESEVKIENVQSFQEITERNIKNKQRIEQERIKDNKLVLKQYRLKH